METTAQTVQGSSAAAHGDAVGPYNLDYSGKTIPHLPPWGPLTVFDVWLNNAALGLYLVTACALLLLPETFEPLARTAFVVAWLMFCADLLLLVADLGDSSRFHHMLRTFRPFSPMWVGVWALSLSAAFTLIPALWGFASLLVVWQTLPAPWSGSLEGFLVSTPATVILLAGMLLGGLCAAAGLAYKGVLFSATSRPVWRKARWFSAYLTNGAVLLGCALLIALGLALDQGQSLFRLFPAMLVLLALDVLLIERHLRPAMSDGSTAQQRRNLGVASALDVAAFICLLGVCLGVGNTALVVLAVFGIVASAFMGRYCFVLPMRGE